MPATLDKLAAVVRRDWLMAVRYRNGFVLAAMGGFAELAAFYYLSRAVGPGFRPEGIDYFPFLLVGTGFYTFLVMGIHSFLGSVEEAQKTGTLEVLMTTSTSAPLLISLNAFSAFSGSAVQLAGYLIAGLLLFGTPIHANLAGVGLVFALSAIVAFAIGTFAAAAQVALQKGSIVLWLLGSGVWFLTGTLFPVETLPKALQYVSAAIPITYALSGMRMSLLRGATFAMVSRDVGALAFFSILLLPSSLAVFSYTLRRARLQGTLSFY